MCPLYLTRGDPLPPYCDNVDLVLAADCVYLESAFPLLEKTLLDLTSNGVLVLMAYKKRRKVESTADCDSMIQLTRPTADFSKL